MVISYIKDCKHFGKAYRGIKLEFLFTEKKVDLLFLWLTLFLNEKYRQFHDHVLKLILVFFSVQKKMNCLVLCFGKKYLICICYVS